MDLIIREYAGKKILLLAPLVNGRKGHYKELFETIRKKGFVNVRVDGEVREITLGMKLDRYKTHNIEAVVDRLKIKDEDIDFTRLRQSVDRAMTQGNGIMMIAEIANDSSDITNHKYFSRNLMCPETGLSYQDPAPHTFSFNSPSGWCPTCKGLGKVKTSELNLQNSEEIDDIIRQEDWFTKLVDYSTDQETDEQEEWCECPDCHGKRLSKEALSYRLGQYTISDLADMDPTL